MSNLYPLTLVRSGKTLLCGAYTLNSLLKEFFPEKIDFSDIDDLLVPSVSNMEKLKKGNTNLEKFKYPWDLIIKNQEIIQKNLEFKILDSRLRKLQEGVYIGKNVRIAPNVIFEANKNNLIVIEDGVFISPFSYVKGPVFINRDSKILDHSSIKSYVSIGEKCKVGGEIEDSIISSFTNKQHFGFMGHSFIGEWVNLGAGTSNSDLKNTYGEIKINYQNQKINTGLQFMGCVVGDFSKTAINTSIYTGKIIGINTHLYASVTKNIPSFVNQTEVLKGKDEEFNLDIAILIQKRMFERRDRNQTKEDRERLEAVFELTKEERINYLNKN